MDNRFVTKFKAEKMGYIYAGYCSAGDGSEERKLKMLDNVREVENISGCKAVATLDDSSNMAVFVESNYYLYNNKEAAFYWIPELIRKIELHKTEIKEAEEKIKRYREDIQKFEDFVISKGNLELAKQVRANLLLYKGE